MNSQSECQASIVVVENHARTRKKIVEILTGIGMEVFPISDGQGCLDCVRQKMPDLVLMDLAAHHLDGIETCRQLKADPVLQNIPVVLMTAVSEEPVLEAALSCGACDFIRKPLNRIELAWRINLVLNDRQSEAQHWEAEKLEVVLENAAAVCHTLNQPLQYVLGAVQILMMDMPPDHIMFNSLDKIREKVEQMGAITRKLAEVTRHPTKTHSSGQSIVNIDRCTPKF